MNLRLPCLWNAQGEGLTAETPPANGESQPLCLPQGKVCEYAD